MPLDALPEHLRDIENHFPDDEQFGTRTLFGRLYRWYQKKTKTWFAFSYRCQAGWARWRKYPMVLFAIGSKGLWRFETKYTEYMMDTPHLRMAGSPDSYLSRIQYYKRWHFAVQWPLMISFHLYPKMTDVPKYGESVSELDGKVWFGYWGHYDADSVYWMITSMYVGKNWK